MGSAGLCTDTDLDSPGEVVGNPCSPGLSFSICRMGVGLVPRVQRLCGSRVRKNGDKVTSFS